MIDNKAKSRRTKVIVGSILGGVTVLGLALAFSGSSSASPAPSQPPAPDPKPPPTPPNPPIQPKPPEPQPPKPAEPKPPIQPKPPGDILEFDLENNWGGLPMETRAQLARIELAAGIPGLGRALGVKAWQAFRAGQALVTPAQAAQIAAENPDLCRLCFNAGDAGPSKTLLDANLGQGWPMPADYAGWAAGSYGLFDMLGAVAVHSGIHQGKFAPLVSLPSAKEAMRRWDVAGFAASYFVWRVLYGPYTVLVPGVNAAPDVADSRATWANIFTVWATPQGFVNKTAEAQAARQRYLDRAAEIGIDLSKVAYPWPPNTSYKPEVWKASVVWNLMQSYMDRMVHDIGGGEDVPPVQQQQQQQQQPAPAPGLGAGVQLPGGIVAFPRIQTQDQSAPLVVVLHGRGGDEKAMLDMVPKDLPARVFFLRGGLKNPSGGYLFFEPNLTAPDATLAPAIRKAGADVVEGLRQLQKLYPTTTVFAVGFSQGAALAQYLAELGAVDGVYAHAGGLPPSLRPVGPAAVKVWQWHGQQDQVVPYDLDKATASSFTASGYPMPVFVTDAGGHRAPKASEVAAAIGPQIGTSLYSGDSGIVVGEGDCSMLISDPGLAAVALSTSVVEGARQLGGGPFTPEAIKGIVDAFLGDLAPYCLLTDKPWADEASAVGGYLAIRATLRALVGRGLMTPADAIGMLADVRAGAIKAGAHATDLPPLQTA